MMCKVVVACSNIVDCDIQGEFEFSEGTSAKWIFDVEIVKLKTQIFFLC